jgi:hypothetical protein
LNEGLLAALFVVRLATDCNARARVVDLATAAVASETFRVIFSAFNFVARTLNKIKSIFRYEGA